MRITILRVSEFAYNQTVHVKVDCPLLIARLVHTPTPATLHIIDSHQGKVKAPMAMVCSYQLTIEEGREVPGIVTTMYLFIFLSKFIYCMLMVRYVSNKLVSCFSAA